MYVEDLTLLPQDGEIYVFYRQYSWSINHKDAGTLDSGYPVTPIEHYLAFPNSLDSYVKLRLQQLCSWSAKWDSKERRKLRAQTIPNASFQYGVSNGVLTFKRLELEELARELSKSEDSSLRTFLPNSSSGEVESPGETNEISKTCLDLLPPPMYLWGRLSDKALLGEIRRRQKQIEVLSKAWAFQVGDVVDERAYKLGQFEGILTLLRAELSQCVLCLIQLGRATRVIPPATNP